MKKWTKVLSAFVVATVMSASMATAIGCGGDDDDKHEHNYSTTWSRDADGHWHECQNDGCDAKKIDSASHSDVKNNETEEVGADGLCDVCGYEVGLPTVEKVTVTFVVGDGVAAIDPVEVNKGEKVDAPTAPTKGGFTFGGWYTEAACENAFDFDTPLSVDVTLHAKWDPVTIEDGVITNVDQFLAFRMLGEVTEGDYKLGADIDLDGVALPAPTVVLKGTATFDGQGHMIMNGNYSDAESKTGLLFKSIVSTSVTNIKFLNCSVNASTESAGGMLTGTVESADGTAAEDKKTTISKIEFNSCSIVNSANYAGLLYSRNEKAAYIDVSEITVKNGTSVVCAQYGGLLGSDSVAASVLVFKDLDIDGKFTSSSNGSFIAGRTRGGNVTIENAVIRAEAVAGNGEGQNGLFVGGSQIDKLTLKNILIVKTDNYYICKSGTGPTAKDYTNVFVVNEGETPVDLLYTKAAGETAAVVGHTTENGENTVAFLKDTVGLDFTDVWMEEGEGGYRLKAASTNVKSPDATLVLMKVSAANAKVRYKMGETQLSTEGLLVMGVYSDGVQLILSEGEEADFTVDASGVHWDTAGKYEITVKGVGSTITATYEIEVVKQTGFKVYQDRMSHVYLEGAKSLDTANLSVKSVWTDGKEETLKLGTDYTVDGYDLNAVGQYTAKVHNGSFDAQDIAINVVKYIPVPVDGVVYVNVDKAYEGVNGTAVKGIVNFNELGDAIKYLEACNLGDVTKVVYVGEGTFAEHIATNLSNLTLIGKGKDKTIMTCSNVQSTMNPLTDKMFGLNDNATLIVNGAGFKMYNMAVRNDFDYAGNVTSKKESSPQGTALLINGDKAVIYGCLLYGNQDTLYLKSGRVYVEKTEIQGNIDFIFGEAKGIAFFEDCTIKAINKAGEGKQEKNNGYVTAMRATADEKPDYGYVFHNCAFTDDGTILDGSMSLGRPWGAAATVAMIDCSFTKAYSKGAYGAKGEDGKEVKPRWYDMSGNKPANADFKEYNSSGDGAISEAVAGGSIISKEDADKHTKANVFAATNGKCTWEADWDSAADLAKLKEYGKWEFVAPTEFAYDVDGVEYGDEGEIIIVEGEQAKFGLAAGPWNSNDKLVDAPIIGDNTIVSYEDGVLKALKVGTTTLTVSKTGIDNVEFTIVVKAADVGATEEKTYTFSYENLTSAGSYTTDQTKLAAGKLQGEGNDFITLTNASNQVTWRDSAKACIESKGDNITVTFVGTGSITISFASTGGNNDSRLGLMDADGAYLEATTVGDGATAVSDAEVGTYQVHGTKAVTVTYTITKAGTYTISCPSGVTTRGTRISGIVMKDNVPASSSSKQEKNYEFSYTNLTSAGSYTTDQTKLAAGKLQGEGNDFITLTNASNQVTWRDSAKACIESKGDNITVTFEGTGTITISFASTGGNNDSRLGLKDADGAYLEATTVGDGATAVSDAEVGTYQVHGTKAVTVTYTITKAGTYTISCPSGVTTRGTRISGIVMKDIV